MNLEEKISEDSDKRLSRTRRVPVGVVGGIVPWNFPVLMAVQKIVPALLSGCTMVLKPSPFTPLATLRMAELIAGVFPPGVLNVITGGDALGPMLTSHPDIDKITFTGSTATGKRVMESASKDLKRITLELGGNDAAIVLPDADVAKVAEKLFWASFYECWPGLHRGKAHLYPRRYLRRTVGRNRRYASAVKVGDGAEQGTAIGPIQNKQQ